MASFPQPVMCSFLADGAIAKGAAVKIGTDAKHVAVCTAVSDKAIGICQEAVTTAEDLVEVAMPGGGAKALAQASFTAGQQLTVGNSSGALKKVATAGDRVIAVALADASASDIVPVLVSISQAYTTES